MNILIAHFCTHWVQCSSGVEKATVGFANELARRGHSVTILYLDQEEGNPYFSLDRQVVTENILFKSHRQVISQKLPVFHRIYREILRPFGLKGPKHVNAVYKGKQYGRRISECLLKYSPDVVVACSPLSAKYVITDGRCQVPVVLMDHDDCNISMPLLSREELQAMGKCKFIQVLLHSFAPVTKKYLPDVPVYVIGNIVEEAKKQAFPGKVKKQYIISCVGSVSHRKNQELLVEAFSKVSKQFPNWNVEIFGGGEDSNYGKSVKKLIEEKQLDRRVYLRGSTRNIADVYAKSDIFATTSTLESWGIALTEAMAAGLPCVGLKSCSGINELILDGKTGFLTSSSAEDYSTALQKLMESIELRGKMGKAGRLRMEEFREDRIIDRWEDLLLHVVSETK